MQTQYGKFVEIPRGDFLMGNDTEYLSFNGETRKEHTHARKVHRVRITKRLAFLETPLTCAHAAQFLERRPGVLADGRFRFKVYDDPEMAYALGDAIEHPPTRFWDESTHRYWRDPASASLPATGFSWDDAKMFCETIGEELAMRVRLPTEAEWEYACRAGTTTVFNFGSRTGDVPDHAWCCANSGLEPKPVRGFRPNQWGLYDIVGNVWEWCQDKYHDNYKGAPDNGSAWEEDDKAAARVFRGGSWSNYAVYCRSAYRGMDAPGLRRNFVGFRLSRSLPLALLPSRRD